jgi:hypothetical protein
LSQRATRVLAKDTLRACEFSIQRALYADPRLVEHMRVDQGAAATAGKIASLPLGKHLFWLNERPKNAGSSSAFAADSRGNLEK